MSFCTLSVLLRTYVLMFPLILSCKNANTLCGVKITFVLSRSTKNNIF